MSQDDDFLKAVEADASGDLVTAAEMYERAIEGNGNLDSYLNLAVLYFQFTDFGFNSGSSYSATFKKQAFDRRDVMIDQAIVRFPNSREARFWKLYIDSQIVGYSLNESQVLEFVQDNKESLVPYFYLYILDPFKYVAQRNLLLESCKEVVTSKNKWILGFIEQEPRDWSSLYESSSKG